MQSGKRRAVGDALDIDFDAKLSLTSLLLSFVLWTLMRAAITAVRLGTDDRIVTGPGAVHGMTDDGVMARAWAVQWTIRYRIVTGARPVQRSVLTFVVMRCTHSQCHNREHD